MVQKVVIRDNTKSPVHYLPELKAFKNGSEYEFKPGVNIIVGKNGCGKTTLMKLIESYLIVDKQECDLGMFNSTLNRLWGIDKNLPDGIDVFADYELNTFRLCHANEKHNDEVLSNTNAFSEYYTQQHSSTGEGVVVALSAMFKRMFSENAKLKFNYDKIGEQREDYGAYIKQHKVAGDEWTILMDEPDRNLDIENIGQIKGVLSFHKPQTQIICVVHNPLLIYALSKNPEVNIIEMTRGYVNNIKKKINQILK